MAELLASATTEATSADFTVAAGTPQTLFLKTGTTETMPSDVRVLLQIKSAGGTYHTVEGAELNIKFRAGVLDGPGTYRVKKLATASGVAYGVDKT